VYSVLARYYDLENAAFTEDLPYWLDLAAEAGEGQVPGDSILEVGSGSGRVLLHLARHGHVVIGLDNSPEMLSLAQERLKVHKGISDKVRLVQADMRDFSLGAIFRAIFLPFNTFAHLLTQADQLAALSAMRRHAAPGTMLAMDLPNASEVYAATDSGLVLERTFHDEARGLTIQQFSHLELDRAAQLGHVIWLYDEIAADRTVRRTTAPVTFRYTFPAEMSLLLERAGFRLQHLYGSYDRAPFGDGAPRMLVVAVAA